MDLFPEERGIRAPHQAPRPPDPAQDKSVLKTHGFENHQGIHPATAGNRKPALKGLTHRLTQPENQCKNTILKITWTIGEGDPFTNLEVHTKEKGNSQDVFWKLRHW